MRNLLDRLLNTVRNILSFADPRYQQHFDWDPTQGGGGGSYTAGDGIDITSNTIRAKVDGNTIQFNTNGQLVATATGDVTKAYVDAADQNLQDQIDERVEKDTGTGQWVYTSEDGATVMKNISNSIDTSTASIPNNKAVKDYVDGELENKADKATTLSGYGITDAYTKTETNTELDKKLDKRTTGVEVYSHSDGTQGAFTVKTAMSSSPTDTNMLTEKAVKTYVDDKDPLAWKYVGILSASHGSVLNVKDDWTELLLAIRVTEGSSTYNLTNVLPKYGFTQGNPSGNQTFAGFFWNESYNAKIRVGIEGSGDSRNLKLNYTNAVGWIINGIYVLKR